MTKKARMTQEEKSELSREMFIQAAFQMLCERGYEGTSLDDIIKKSGRSKGAFYHHFDSKEELFRKLFEEIILMVGESFDRMEAALDDGLSLRDAALKSFEASEVRLKSAYQMRSIVELYFVGLRDPWVKKLLRRLQESIIDIFSETLTLAMKQGKIRHLENPREVAEMIHQGSRGVLFMEIILNDGKNLGAKLTRFFDHELAAMST